MSVFQDIIKGMADGAEALQANFAKLTKSISAIDDDGTIHFGSVSADNLAVNGDTDGFIDISDGNNTVYYKITNGNLLVTGRSLSISNAQTANKVGSLPTSVAQRLKLNYQPMTVQYANVNTAMRGIITSSGDLIINQYGLTSPYTGGINFSASLPLV